jgi:hypothetical protein
MGNQMSRVLLWVGGFKINKGHTIRRPAGLGGGIGAWEQE